MNHGPFWSYWHTTSYSTATWQELDDHCLYIEDMPHHCAIQETYQLRNAWTPCTGPQKLQARNKVHQISLQILYSCLEISAIVVLLWCHHQPQLSSKYDPRNILKQIVGQFSLLFIFWGEITSRFLFLLTYTHRVALPVILHSIHTF